MSRRIVIIQGHPDPAGGHFCHALADAYAIAAREAGYVIDVIDVAGLRLPLLQSRAEWQAPANEPAILTSQRLIQDADHLLVIYPLWLGSMPAVLKGFLEQVMRPGFAVQPGGRGMRFHRLLRGRSARIVVTMGMPALVYRLFFFSHSLRSLERNVLSFVGIAPVHETLVGRVESVSTRRHYLRMLEVLGSRGA